MGYITRFDGELAIVPPLTWAEVKASNFEPARAESVRLDVKLRISEVDVDTDEGVMIRRAGVALVPTYEDEMRGYDIVEHVQRFLYEHPGHDLTGRLDCEGEEAGDLWRLQVHDGRAVKIKPRIVWSDGTEQEIR